MVFCKRCGTKLDDFWNFCPNSRTRIHSNNLKHDATTIIDKNGYRRFKDTNKLVHRYVIEKALGRKLRDDEVVHHINLIKLDNRQENLRLFSNQRAHERFHENLDHSKCPECGNYLVKKKGRYGVFWGCTNYPNCRYTRPLPSKKSF